MVPTWFGPDAAPLFGWFHAPADGRMRGVVVLCPPVGLEMLVTYRTLRILADRLAATGVGVLRFAYATTGDSAGESTDPERVARWLASVGDAVSYARSAGASRVVVAGVRLGATLAAAAARTCSPLDGLVLWDPCESGASFLREEQALFRIGVPAPQRTSRLDGAVEGPGSLYPPEAVAALGRVNVEALLDGADDTGADDTGADTDGVFPGAGPVLVVTRSESRARAGVRRLASAAGVESFEAPGQTSLFDWLRLEVPVATLDRIVEWVSRLLPDTGEDVVPQTRDAAVVTTTADGRAVRERVVQVGAAGMFGIMTEVEGAGEAVMVMTNAAPPACHIGPARLWVELARAWAADGMRVLRFDDAGIGDSPGGGDLDGPAVYSESPVRDVVAAVQSVRAAGARYVGLTGLCSAAWACLLAAARVQVETVNALNPGVWDVRPPRHLTQPRMVEPAVRLRSGRLPVVAGLKSRVRNAARLAARLLLPESVWWRLGRSGHIEAPAGLITPLILRGTRVRLLFGHREASAFRERRGDRLMTRFGHGGPLEIHEAEDIDHALMSLQAREVVVERLAAWVSTEHE